MNSRLKNYVFCDGVDQSKIDEVRAKLPEGTVFAGPPPETPPEDGGHYVVLTDAPAKYAKKYISNNVIGSGQGADKIANDVEWIFSDFGRGRRKGDGPRTFVTSDTHFGHLNIIRYCGRPWSTGKDPDGSPAPTQADLEEMNAEMTRRWNETVRPDDVVYHLGDFAFGGRDKAAGFLAGLNGRVRLVLGNHDRLKVGDYYAMGFDRVYDMPVIIRDFVVLSHAPLHWVKAPMFNLFGHVHDSESYPTMTRNSCCVCVERWDYRPVALDQIETGYRAAFGQD